MKSKNLIRLLIAGVIIVTVALLAGSISMAASSIKIAVFNMDRLQSEFPDLAKLQQQLKDKESEFNLFRGYLYQDQQKQINELVAKANQEKNGKTADEQGAIDKRLQESKNKLTDALNNQLEEKRAELVKFLNDQKQLAIENLDKIIAEIAKDKKYSLVMEKGSVHYGGEDITQLILDKAKKANEDASKNANKK